MKIRGYRIELGEIVSCLNRLPGVEASAAAVHTIGDVPSLIAYVVLSADARQRGLTANDFREYLASRLPDYMVPAAIVSLADLPITSNGKLDRAGLPPPSQDNVLPGSDVPATHPGHARADCGTAGAPSAPPSDSASVQGQLAELVASLVGQSVAADEDFFLVGGHSMLGVQLLSRIKDHFGVKLSLRQLFSTPTVAGLRAAIIRQIDNS